MSHDTARILVIDDNPAIHDVFANLLTQVHGEDDELDTLEAELFGTRSRPPREPAMVFELDSSNQGQRAVEQVTAALDAGHPYTVAFVDMRMPPGWDGVRTMHELWRRDPELEMVLCTAYAEKDWQTILYDVERPERLLVLKKPFDGIEVVQMARSLSLKWHRRRALRQSIEQLQRQVREQRQALERIHEERSHAGSDQAPGEALGTATLR